MTTPGAGRRLLAVDDAAEMRLLLELALREGGFEVDLVADGAAALAAVAAERYDGVVLDVELGAEDGRALLDRLPAGLPVVLLTGSPAAVAGQAGVAGVLAKPFDVAALAAEVAGLLGVGAP